MKHASTAEPLNGQNQLQNNGWLDCYLGHRMEAGRRVSGKQDRFSEHKLMRQSILIQHFLNVDSKSEIEPSKKEWHLALHKFSLLADYK